MRKAEKEHVQTIGVAAQLDQWPSLLEWLQQFGAAYGLQPRLQAAMQLVCEEWFINIVRYGFRQDVNLAEPYVQVIIRSSLYTPKKVWILFIDNGMPFNPLYYMLPNIELPEQQRPIGGLGIYMIRQKTSSCRYSRADGYNYFTMVLKSEGGN